MLANAVSFRSEHGRSLQKAPTRKATALLYTILAGLAAIACTPSATPESDTPESAAKHFFMAISESNGVKVDSLTCRSQKAELKSGAVLTAPIVLGIQSLPSDVAFDVSDLQTTVLSRTGDTASVRLTFKISGQFGQTMFHMSSGLTWQMVKEDGNWKYCGTAPASSTRTLAIRRLESLNNVIRF
jgi:hypothetical protein